jgi:site-specific DNA-methyltransferase (adenine-specific)
MKDRNLNSHDSWATPKSLYEGLNKEFNFDFDPCPLNTGEITPETDGLLIDWGDSNFINPPYSRALKEAFVKRAIEFSGKGRLCVMLLPVSTSTKLFHDHILPNADDIRFLRGRVKFEGVNTFGERVTNKAGMHDSMIVVFYPKPADVSPQP